MEKKMVPDFVSLLSSWRDKVYIKSHEHNWKIMYSQQHKRECNWICRC